MIQIMLDSVDLDTNSYSAPMLGTGDRINGNTMHSTNHITSLMGFYNFAKIQLSGQIF